MTHPNFEKRIGSLIRSANGATMPEFANLFRPGATIFARIKDADVILRLIADNQSGTYSATVTALLGSDGYAIETVHAVKVNDVVEINESEIYLIRAPE